MPHVFVTRALPGDPTPRLREVADVDVWPDEEPPSHDELVRRAADADALLTMLSDPIDAAVLDAGKRLRIVAQMAVGYDNIDVAAATERGILVTNTPGVLTETTADLAFALLLAAARRVVEGDRLTRTGGWKSWHPSFMLGQDVYGATLGIVGLGEIGQAVARRARGFDMRILYSQPGRGTSGGGGGARRGVRRSSTGCCGSRTSSACTCRCRRRRDGSSASGSWR